MYSDLKFSVVFILVILNTLFIQSCIDTKSIASLHTTGKGREILILKKVVWQVKDFSAAHATETSVQVMEGKVKFSTQGPLFPLKSPEIN